MQIPYDNLYKNFHGGNASSSCWWDPPRARYLSQIHFSARPKPFKFSNKTLHAYIWSSKLKLRFWWPIYLDMTLQRSDAINSLLLCTGMFPMIWSMYRSSSNNENNLVLCLSLCPLISGVAMTNQKRPTQILNQCTWPITHCDAEVTDIV